MKSEPFHDCQRKSRRVAAQVRALFLAAFLGLCGAAHGQLKWEERGLEFHPSFSDTQVTAEFHFANIGKKAIKIRDVTTSCGCTTASLDKNHVYQPGEKGKITAVFDIGGRHEPQTETLDVKTTDPNEPELVLQFKVIIPKLLDIDNIFLTWQHGEELKPKTVAIKVAGDYPVHQIAVSSSSPDVTVEVKHAEGSRDFVLVVTPKKIDGQFVILDIKPDYPKDTPKLFHVYASLGR